jgi:hypothetical protein
MINATTAIYEQVLRNPVPLRRATANPQASPMDESA